MVALTLRNTKGSPLTNTEMDNNFSNLNAAVQPAGGTAGQVLVKVDATDYNSQWIDNYSIAMHVPVKAGIALTKGQVVYISGAAGANPIVSKAQANAEPTSSKVFGFINSTLALNDFGEVVTEGPITGVDTSLATEGDPVWLSPTVAGGVVFGLANKPTSPDHLVYLGVVSRAHAVNGVIQVKVQNGYELDELHDVHISSPTGEFTQELSFQASTGLWKNNTKSTSTVAEGTNLYYTDARVRAAISASAPLSLNLATGAITISQASTVDNGYLSSTDWNTFNGKQVAYTILTTFGSLTNASGWLKNNGSGVLSYSTPTYSDVGAPSTSGTNATGSWGIDITGSSASCTGNAATATTAGTADALNTSNGYTAVKHLATGDGTNPSFDGITPNNGSTGGFRIRGNATSLLAYIQWTDAAATAQWMSMSVNSSGTATWTGNHQFNSIGVGTAGSGTAGEIRATNNITAYYSSDRRLKENIKEVDNALDIAVAIGSKTFDWTDAYIAEHGGVDGYFIQKSDFGVIAQDVQAVFPQAVRTREDGTLAVDYEKLGTLAFGAISQLLKRVEALENR